MLRIGEFSDTFLPIVDGVGRVVHSYAEGLCQLGHQVTVVAPMGDTGYRGGYPYDLVDFIGMRVPLVRQYQTGEAVADGHYRRRIREVELDICHSHSPFLAGSEALRLAAQRNIPLVGTFHSKYYDDFLKTLKSETLAKLGVKLVVDYYSRCDEVWAVSDSTADTLRGYGYTGEIQVMQNGTNLRDVDPDALAEAERRWDFGDLPLLLFVGQMDWKKNINCILEACAALRRSGFVFRLALAGQGPDRDAIDRRVDELGLRENARLVGHITDTKLLDALFARASLFVFPSLYDNAPMVVREAAAMGTPAVLARGSTAAEIIRDGENGLLCENDGEDLARVIRGALADSEHLARMGAAARESIPIPWQGILAQVADRYADLIERNRAGELPKKTKRLL